jgi:hypothetical protein|tara:strand:- start:13 stop:186 length:174 start_codon:yes stop_codon:yes gene_type:complete
VTEYIEVNPVAVETLNTKTLEIIKAAEEIVMIPHEDERVICWATFLDELGIKAELLV